MNFKRLVLSAGPAGDAELKRELNRYLAAVFVLALPCMVLGVRVLGTALLAVWAAAFVSWAVCEWIFAAVRRKPVGGGALVFSLLYALMVPPGVPLWMAALGAAFGALFAKEVFGGTGYHVFNPALVAKAFITFSYPAVCTGASFSHLLGYGTGDHWIPAAVLALLAAAVLAVVNRKSLWTFAGLLMGLAAVGLALQVQGRLPYATLLEFLVGDGTLFVACFLAADPVGSPRDTRARFLFGLLVGAAGAVMRGLSNYQEAMLCAVLLGNLVAPTFDLMAGKTEGAERS